METINIKLTKQEQDMISYLSGKSEVAWEELAQFGKDPQSVKLKTIKRAVSEIKKKFRDANIQTPFECLFKSLTTEIKEEVKKEESKLIPVKKTPSGNIIPPDYTGSIAHLDFKLIPFTKSVQTKKW